MWRWCKMEPPPRRVRANHSALRPCRPRLNRWMADITAVGIGVGGSTCVTLGTVIVGMNDVEGCDDPVTSLPSTRSQVSSR